MNTAGELPESRRLAGAWFLLALLALGVSALLAVVLVAARTPFLGLGAGFFRTALVLHVDMAVVVWFFAAAAGLWSLARGRAGPGGWAIFWVAALAVPVLLLSPFMGLSAPVLANYIPLLNNWAFIIALAVFLLAVLVAAAWSLGAGGWRGLPPWGQACRWSVAVVVLAAAVYGIDYADPRAASIAVRLAADDYIWGAGHLLQFVHGTLLLGVWSVLGDRLIAASPWLRRAFPWLVAGAALPALAGLGFALAYETGSASHRLAFTELMRWGSWPAPLLAGFGLLAAAASVRRQSGALERGEHGLLLSVLLFALGCGVGTLIHGNATTLVPAHYHGTVGAVTLAYLLFSLRIAQSFGLPAALSPRVGAAPAAYGLGVGILVIGLAWSGLLGVPRKSPHEEIALEAAGYYAGMGLAGVGGLIALVAVVAFVLAIVIAAWGRRPAGGRRRDQRAGALALTAAAVIAGGFLLGDWPSDTGEDERMHAHAVAKQRQEIDERFQQGVVMLHGRQYEYAATAFLRVIELAPEMPEAYVNAGFAFYGLKRYSEAADFFDSATQIRPDQMNAYYGLGMALAELGNVQGALQALETYLHRASRDDRFRPKAEAAVWELREGLAKAQAAPGEQGVPKDKSAPKNTERVAR